MPSIEQFSFRCFPGRLKMQVLSRFLVVHPTCKAQDEADKRRLRIGSKQRCRRVSLVRSLRSAYIQHYKSLNGKQSEITHLFCYLQMRTTRNSGMNNYRTLIKAACSTVQTIKNISKKHAKLTFLPERRYSVKPEATVSGTIHQDSVIRATTFSIDSGVSAWTQMMEDFFGNIFFIRPVSTDLGPSSTNSSTPPPTMVCIISYQRTRDAICRAMMERISSASSA